ncbi:hypothetical protein [Coleofasciculus sp. FACHB-542]|uniref:hypothetical protein n=1 Tax=Coleofasciculus sp. FACHB-542 TaxID=2692787 RepID=UPI00168A239D|nr:hypothetical protein [Coleofasciculus sp. FACHB-542]
MNFQFVTDLATHINPHYHVVFPSKLFARQLTAFNSSVYDERGNLRASLNSSVRFSASTPYTSAIIDWVIAEDLLKLSHQAPLFAAWYYSYDDPKKSRNYQSQSLYICL